MIGVLVISSTTVSTVLLRRVGAKVLVPTGMVLAAIAMAILPRRRPPRSRAARARPPP